MYSLVVKKQYYKENKEGIRVYKGFLKFFFLIGSRWGDNTWHSVVGVKKPKKTPLNLKGYTKENAAVPTRMPRKICSLQHP